jgi:hypothetical protein
VERLKKRQLKDGKILHYLQTTLYATDYTHKSPLGTHHESIFAQLDCF